MIPQGQNWLWIFLVVLLCACGGQPTKAPVGDRTARKAPAPAKPPPPVAVAIPLSGIGANATYHKVIPGDTLHSVAWRYRKDYQQIANWNQLSPPYTIRAGQLLRVQPYPEELATPVKPAAPKEEINAGQVRSSVPIREQSRAAPAGSPEWYWPTDGPLLKQSSGKTESVQGIDIGGQSGQAVRAAASGKVVYMGSGLASYGQLIIIKHSNNFLSAYAHNRRLLVKEGEKVQAEQIIAEMGSSGTDRAKLHFEIRRDGKPVNPIRYLPKR